MTDDHASEAEIKDPADDREPPPGLPEIRDEAADTPRWVPLVGLGLLAASVLAVAVTATLTSDDAADVAEEAEALADDDDE
jgi:hypothetical protein